jgi:hypothetical protein
MSVSVSSSTSTDVVQLLMLRKQMDAQATQSAQLLEGLQAAPAAAAPPARPDAPSGTWYL